MEVLLRARRIACHMTRYPVFQSVAGGSPSRRCLQAVALGREDLVEMLLKRQAHLQAVDRNGNSVLHLATRVSNVEVRSRLLERRACTWPVTV